MDYNYWKLANSIKEETEVEEAELEEAEPELEETELKTDKPSFFSRFTGFFSLIVDPQNSLGEDHYVPMFMADLIVFVLTILFFNNFSIEPNSDLESVSFF